MNTHFYFYWQLIPKMFFFWNPPSGQQICFSFPECHLEILHLLQGVSGVWSRFCEGSPGDFWLQDLRCSWISFEQLQNYFKEDFFNMLIKNIKNHLPRSFRYTSFLIFTKQKPIRRIKMKAFYFLSFIFMTQHLCSFV